ncbi:MAG: biotin/lipoyl-binding protein [Terriglobales bacterium]
MNFTQPFSVGVTVAEFTTPVTARVPGRVIEVPVQDNSPVQRGDVLFRMDPQPYRDSFHAAQAAATQADIQTRTAITQAAENVKAATANVHALEAAIQATTSAMEATKAHLALAKTRLRQYTELASKHAGSQFEVERYDTDVSSLNEQVAAQQQQIAAQQQQLAAAVAQQAQASVALAQATSMRPAVLAQANSQLDAAKWNLEQTTVYAPDDGYVTQLQLQPGAVASLGPTDHCFLHAFLATLHHVDQGELAAGTDGLDGHDVLPVGRARLQFRVRANVRAFIAGNLFAVVHVVVSDEALLLAFQELAAEILHFGTIKRQHLVGRIVAAELDRHHLQTDAPDREVDVGGVLVSLPVGNTLSAGIDG